MNDNHPNLQQPSAVRVIWMTEAARGLCRDLIQQVNTDLWQAFSRHELNQIVVKQRFRGFSDQPQSKLIVAVEIQYADQTRSSVLKVGQTNVVRKDFDRWQTCATSRGITSRMFIAPVLHEVSSERVIVEYPDVYQYYYNNGRDDEPKDLETLVRNCIDRNLPTVDSVERVLTQVFTEAYRCFYRAASEDTTHDRILHAVRRSLRIGEDLPVLQQWQKDEYLILRRGAAWQTCGHRQPDATDRPDYVDPVDYLSWAIDKQQLPDMLVGPAHGDLHGRNIIAGVVRGEAEWPAVFDFDKMKSENLVAWDFAKLELELKCCLFSALYSEDADRQEVRQWLGLPERAPLPESVKLSAEEQRIQEQAERMEVMFAIEKLLRDDTANFYGSYVPTKTVVVNAQKRTHKKLSPLLAIILRIRREAAIVLGFDENRRENRWKDEYYFALAVYGVVAGKWHSPNDHLAWSLLSAGVACAQLSQLPWPPDPDKPPSVDNAPTYLHVLPYAHACWKSKKWSAPVPMLQSAAEKFPYAVALKQELALCLSESSDEADEETARREIATLANLACVYRDHETLSRLGRIDKDQGDRHYDGKFSCEQMIADRLPSYQCYLASLKRYGTAWDVSRDYYPGINAATLSLLTGDKRRAKELANMVRDLCGTFDLDRSDRIWILASEGEASLLLGHTPKAVQFYRSAISRVLPSEITEMQSIYNQLCRLHWALSGDVVQPVIEMMQAEGRLDDLSAGPFGNCGRVDVGT